jgi:hypothetical protein
MLKSIWFIVIDKEGTMKNRDLILFDVLPLLIVLVALTAIVLPQYAKSQAVLVLGEELEAVEKIADTEARCDGSRYESERGVFSCTIERLPIKPERQLTTLTYYGDGASEKPTAILRKDWGGLLWYESLPKEHH